MATMRTPQQKASYLSNLFEETYLRDIVERNKLRQTQELDDLVDVLTSATGSLTSLSKIEATLISELGSKVSTNTLKAYIGHLKDAFVISETNRYDIKGRKYIGTVRKYYFEDVGLRNARLGFRQVEENHLMENIVYNELRARGFSVDVGVVIKREKDTDGRELESQLEVDFVANLAGGRYYIQSAYAIPNDEERHQEKASLLRVRDSFEKVVLIKDIVNTSRDQNGIVTMGLFDFPLDEDNLRV